MTVSPSIDPARLLEEQLAQASPDLLRQMLQVFINTLLGAEADAVCGAAYGTVSPERVNQRNGYRHRDFDTRAGTLDVAIPKLREGNYFPEWLLERRKRAERALTSVVATCYLLGVSTRRMDKLVQSLGITTLSKSQVSEMAKDLDAHVEEFRTRRLEDAGPFTFVAADALVLKTMTPRSNLGQGPRWRDQGEFSHRTSLATRMSPCSPRQTTARTRVPLDGILGRLNRKRRRLHEAPHISE
jgi:putative transposase